MEQAQREEREIEFWSASQTEGPGQFSIGLLTHKMGEARVFLEKYERFEGIFRGAGQILELGGGQCWASAIVKAHGGDHCFVLGSDISPYAVVSTPRWEAQFGARLDGALACRSYSVPLADCSIDLAFAFASAHHFAAHRKTFLELARLVKPGGKVLYLHEPSCSSWIYRAALRRVLAKRPEVPEDVLRFNEIAKLANDAGFDVALHPAPTTTYRGAVETVYYLVLQKLAFLQRLLPCTFDYEFTRR